MKKLLIIIPLLLLTVIGCHKDSQDPVHMEVKYDGNGGTTSDGQTIARRNHIGNYQFILDENMFTNGNKIFVGWSRGPSDNNIYQPGQTAYITYDYNYGYLCARWGNTITFNANGGSGTMSPQTILVGKSENIKANNFTKSGYEFDGWNTKADGTGTSYSDKQYISLSSSITLYAQWSSCKYYHNDYYINDIWVWGTWSSTNYNYCFGTNSYGYTKCAERVYNSGTKTISDLKLTYGAGGSSGSVKISFCNSTYSGPGTVIKEISIPMSTLYQNAVSNGVVSYNNHEATVLISNFSEFNVSGDFYVVVDYSNAVSRFYVKSTYDGAYSDNTAYYYNGSSWNHLSTRVLSLGLRPNICPVGGGKTDGEDDIIVMPMPNEEPSQGFGVEIE